MVKEDLVRYVQAYLTKGYTREQIQQTLLGSGYPVAVIQGAFAEVARRKTYASFPQTYQNDSPNARQTSYTPGRNIPLIIIGIVIIIIIAGVIFYFMMADTNGETYREIVTTTSTTTTTSLSVTATTTFPLPDESIEVYETLLCSNIDEGFNCFENRRGEFARGESVFIYMKLFLDSKSMSGVHKIGFIEDREVVGPDGNLIEYLSYDNVMDVTREVPEISSYSIPVYNEIITTEFDEIGSYNVKMTIRDKYSRYSTVIEKEYVLI